MSNQETFRMMPYSAFENDLSNLIDAAKDFSLLLDNYVKQDKEWEDMNEKWMPADPYKNFKREDVLDKMEKVTEASNQLESKVKQEALANFNSYEARFRDVEKNTSDLAFAQAVDKSKGFLLGIYSNQVYEIAEKQRELNKHEPRIEPKPALSVFQKFQASDGNTFNKYDDYLKAQEKLINEFKEKTQENLNHQKDINNKYHALEQAKTPKELLQAGNQCDGNIRSKLLQSSWQILQTDQRFSQFREQRETFLGIKEQHDQARVLDRKKEHGFER
jgi:hypothetical protein